MLTKQTALQELKHSINLYIMLLPAPSAQLTVYLLKLIDFLEDDDQERCLKEMVELAYLIVNNLATTIYMQVSSYQECVADLKAVNDNLLIIIKKSVHWPNRTYSKNLILQALAPAIKKYYQQLQKPCPVLKTASGVVL